MPDPAGLISLARTLAEGAGTEKPTDAHLRRSISTAYYAVFHTVLRAAADRFVGGDQVSTVAYAVVYRSFDHRHMREMCNRLRVSVLKDKYRHLFERDALSLEARQFATAFPLIQDARVRADYDPQINILDSDAHSTVDAAEAAMAVFNDIAWPEKADLLALLMTDARR